MAKAAHANFRMNMKFKFSKMPIRSKFL